MNFEKQPGPDFIEQKYPDTADNKRLRKPVTERFERIEQNPKTLRKLENLLTENFVLDVSDEETLVKLAKALYESEKRIAIEQGRGAEIQKLELNDTELLQKYKEAMLEKEALQKQTLKTWFEYIRQNDADYPMWFRYYVVRSLRGLGQFSRDEKLYSSRTGDTIAPFPEMNAEALGFVYKALLHEFEKDSFDPEIGEVALTQEEQDEVAQKVGDESKLDFALKGRLRNKRAHIRKEQKNAFQDEKNEAFMKEVPLNEERREELSLELVERLKAKDFAKLYAFAQVECAGNLDRESLTGEWVKYEKGSDYRLLENGLKGKGTGWCTAEGSAKGQVETGDFYVYYTINKAGIPTEPRIAIRMSGDTIGEIRGVNPRQELEPELVETAKEKYGQLPGAEKYEKKDSDMRRMTAIYSKCFEVDKEKKEKVYLEPVLSKDELTFLYEINSSIEGFGYQKDPRIEEIRNRRNIMEDALTVFECTQEQLATSASEVSESTKAYIGEWNPVIYHIIKDYRDITHLYESFPDKKIFIYELTTDQAIQSSDQAKQKLEEKGIFISEDGKDLINKTEFSQRQERYTLVQFTVGQLGFSQGATTDQIYEKAQDLGLKLCPAEIGPQLRLAYEGKDWKFIAMKQIADRAGLPRVFNRDSDDARLNLYAAYAFPGNQWNPDIRFVFLAS